MGVTIGAALLILHALRSPRAHTDVAPVATGGEPSSPSTREDSSLPR